MKRIILLLTVSFASLIIFAQDMTIYTENVKKAEDFYKGQQYLESARSYSKAFESIEWKAYPVDRYNAACSWSLATEIDSSFNNLFRLAKNSSYKNLTHLLSDTDLNNLHQDQRWNELVDLVKSNKEKAEANLNKPLVRILDSIYVEDQKYRIQMDSISKQFGWKSEEVQAHWKTIHEKDSLNQIVVKKIIDEFGWLGADVIGEQGNSTLFLVIQHSDLKTQLEYLPLMREAVEKGNANSRSLALLEDRTSLGQGKPQIYGSQIWSNPETGELFVAPLIDPENVDSRRAEVGLDSLSSYIGNWQLKWNIEEYLEKLPEYEKMLNK
jgi:hypothetical protein